MFLRRIADLAVQDIDWILKRADEYRLGAPVVKPMAGVVGLLFLDASLRTHVGFASAAVRLGATPISVVQHRVNELSAAESTTDTLRIVCGYSDIVVARVPEPFDALPRGVTAHVINGGDRGPLQEHPSQALVDLFALRRQPKSLSELVIALVGDLRMRAARSLLAIFELFPPKRILIVTLGPLECGLEIPRSLLGLVARREIADLRDADIVYMIGIPDGAIPEDGRSKLRLNEEVMRTLSIGAAVLSPMPLIDEVQPEIRGDSRIKFYRQSDEAIFVRMALLEYMMIN